MTIAEVAPTARRQGTPPTSAGPRATGSAERSGGTVRRPERRTPPVWKENVLVLVGLYPTVILFTVLVAPHLTWAGDALGMLLGNVVTVGLLGWPILGWLRRRFDWWLQAEPGDRRAERRGAAVLLGVLAALTGLAHLLVTVTGGLP